MFYGLRSGFAAVGCEVQPCMAMTKKRASGIAIKVTRGIRWSLTVNKVMGEDCTELRWAAVTPLRTR